MVALCFGCKNAPAELWCEVCAMFTSGYLCSDCDKTEHATKTGQHHTRMTLEEKANRDSIFRSVNTVKSDNENRNDEQMIYCNGCDCRICLAVHAYADSVRVELKESLRPLGDTQFLVDMKDALTVEQKRNKQIMAELEKK